MKDTIKSVASFVGNAIDNPAFMIDAPHPAISITQLETIPVNGEDAIPGYSFSISSDVR
eukprot:CAMPEP_0194139226 /NCGR_PEP_ID=MMETSP0152-20130528/8931_1 /TAXON_ID=1049557 /ORGANISM="Thalassiothrix antarctica, Strain L6-D1" /LENGTH=58 /DNA_ID=CAMNT_0038837005 /DNA_START=1104 /DNA_END=1280 /DNA_ORIENTATION=+